MKRFSLKQKSPNGGDVTGYEKRLEVFFSRRTDKSRDFHSSLDVLKETREKRVNLTESV